MPRSTGTAHGLALDPVTHAVETDSGSVPLDAHRVPDPGSDLARSSSPGARASSASVAEVVDEALRDARSGAADRNVDIAVDIDHDLTWSVPLDLGVRALTPLLTNAARMASTNVRLSAMSASDGSVAVAVEDDGPGVERARRDMIFRPGETSGGGAGLGLALSRRIARVSGGDVTLDPAPGPTRFVLRLPG